jgi:putative transcriptional regulator
MKRDRLAELLKAATQALEHAQGKRELRTTVLPPAPAPVTAAQVRRIRKQLNASQAVFARYLNVSTRLVQAWEADRRSPEGPALMLLRLGERDPAALVAAAFGVNSREIENVSRRGRSTKRRMPARAIGRDRASPRKR